jgi:hypothetical protein
MYLELKLLILGSTEFFQEGAPHVPNRILMSPYVGIHVLHARMTHEWCCRTIRRLESIRKLGKLLSLELRTVKSVSYKDRVMLKGSRMGHMDGIHSRL